MFAYSELNVSDAGRALRQKSVDNPDAFAVVLAGPSGVGKTSMCEAVLGAEADVRKCVTTTTRPKRMDEVDGVSRHFVSVDKFKTMLKRGEFVENAGVHGYLYGATFDAVSEALSGGRVMLMDVDVQGVATWQRVLEDRCVTVFVVPPSLEVLAERLAARESEAESTFNLRMENAIAELRQSNTGDFIIVNDKLENAVSDLRAIVRAERRRTSRMVLSVLDLGSTDSHSSR
jgi:guanylate kinase